jgi:cytochrome c oxidase subunit II
LKRAVLVGPVLLAACEGAQSVLAPHGPEAGRVALLFWVMTGCATAILIGVGLMGAAAIYGSPRARQLLSREGLVIGGGIVFPIVALSALLGYGLAVMRGGPEQAAEPGAPRIEVMGERWWWRVIYTDEDGRRFESANEIRIPIGRPIQLALSTADVIHSFWVPSLAGKLDMIPGRINRMRLAADRPGIHRGQCAEYCGGAHALMSFYVVAMPSAEYAVWLKRESGAAAPPTEARAAAGERLFLSSGCGGCHTVRGTPANGRIGPDLTHVGGRLSLAAATLEQNETTLARWIVENQHIKPENLMPPYGIFAPEELQALAAYLAALK